MDERLVSRRSVNRALPATPSIRSLALILALGGGGCAEGSTASTTPPTLTPDSASLIMIDEAHNNFHTVGGRYAPFATLLRSDGWTVQGSGVPLSIEALRRGRILVIANALAAENLTRWSLPTPSAFSAGEITAVRDWVHAGGGLLLIADHMPFPGAAEQLAAAFGVHFTNGFAFDTLQLRLPVTCLAPAQIQIFRRSDGSLVGNALTDGRNVAERVDSVATFTGQAFETDANATPLLVFGANAISLTPDSAWQFTESTARIAVTGWYQGAMRRFGVGRAAFFGEAAMFTEQTCGAGIPMGFNAPAASQNARFLQNVVNWLAGRLD